MFIHNSLSGKKEKIIKPFFWKKIHMFVCGPTVFDEPHIGNFRTFVAFDAIVRYMRSVGFRVFYLQNITDIDDKIIARAKERNKSWKDIARAYEKKFLDTVEALNIRSVDAYARATEHIPEIIRQIQILIRKGSAYKIENDGWYFDLSTFPDYGKLARRTTAQAEDGVSRIDTSEKKKNAGDFCLWKFSSSENEDNLKYEPAWDTKIGKGRPGWHIEDTAITEKFFGPQYDIHGGGMDLKFPHHEAEIAQQESASGKKPFVKVWMHTGFLQVNGQKMSKSLGNFVTMSDALERLSPDEFRYMAISHHYSAPLNFSDDEVSSAKTNFGTIKDFLLRLSFVEKYGKNNGKEKNSDIVEYEKKFKEAMEDDFNTPEAIASIRMLMNSLSPDIFLLSPKTAKTARIMLEKKLGALGFSSCKYDIPEKVRALANERELSRTHKQFTHADSLRKEIHELGYDIEDTPLGPFVRKSQAPKTK